MAPRKALKRARSPEAPSFTASKFLKRSMENQTKVALEIIKQLQTEKGKHKDMVYSPLSIHVVLSIIAAGAKGRQQDQMLTFLKATSINELKSLVSKVVPFVFTDGSSRGGPSLSFANSVWIDESLIIKPSFKQVVDTDFKGALKQADFENDPEEGRREVNLWGSKETNGLVQDILPPGSVSCTTRLVLANALYFKGTWDVEFDASRTREHEFHLHNGSSVRTPFMTMSSKQYISVFETFKVLKLPYKQGRDHQRKFSMYIFLPNAKQRLQAMVEKLCSRYWFINSHLPEEKVKVGKFLIPKFKISYGFEASKVLKTMGCGPGALTEMVDPPLPLDVSFIFQKAFVEVNERGTEAAVVTTGGMYVAAKPPDIPINFVGNHPFLYLIREEVTGTVMFIGQVFNPTDRRLIYHHDYAYYISPIRKYTVSFCFSALIS